MKKLFYGLGAIAAIATPLVAVISCGDKPDTQSSDQFNDKAVIFDKDKMEIVVNFTKIFKLMEPVATLSKAANSAHNDFIIQYTNDHISDPNAETNPDLIPDPEFELAQQKINKMSDDIEKNVWTDAIAFINDNLNKQIKITTVGKYEEYAAGKLVTFKSALQNSGDFLGIIVP